MINTQQEGRLRWVKASERLPKEHTWVIFQWEDTKKVFREKPFNIRDENGNIGGLALLKWLEEYSPLTEDELKQKYAEELGYKLASDLETSDSSALEFAYKTMTNESHR